MAPHIKYEDTPYEPTSYSRKIFIYNDPTWGNLFPIVDIIRLLEKNTIIGYKYGKGSIIVKTYGKQYYHRVLGYEINNNKDYLTIINSLIRVILIFSDVADNITKNLINLSTLHKINLICYSNLDLIYHFYDYSTGILVKSSFNKPEDVVNYMYSRSVIYEIKKFDKLFPEFEIIENELPKSKSTLEECVNILKLNTDNELSNISKSKK